VNQPHNEAAPRDAAAHEGLAGLFLLAALLGDSMDQGLAEHGLTRARGEVMWTLHHRGPMTQRELSQALRCSPRNVTGLLDALQAAHFVTRDAHPTDRRATLVNLTEHGSTTVSAWSAEYDEFAATLFTDLTTPELTSFVTALNRVLARLRDAAPARAVEAG
jgi:DNA-binding MarR family transcriptional regulator